MAQEATVADSGSTVRSESAGYAAVTPALSVLVPFKGDDPSRLLTALRSELAASPEVASAAEIVLYDDGSRDPSLSQAVNEQVAAGPGALALLTEAVNQGRSAARNRLVGAARGSHLLFLDADMEPAGPHFLHAWLEVVREAAPAVAFGGFTVDRATDADDTALHRAFAAGADCVPVHQRRSEPAKHVFTSNLLVRAEVVAEHPFDPGFVGWGWEDVDWAARVEPHVAISHVDIPATHHGLETPDQLLDKFRASAENFARFAARHPELVRRFPSHRAARVFAAIPLSRLVRPVLARVVRARRLVPMRARVLALKLWRASWYSEALR